MKRFCTFIAVLLGLVMPSQAIAGTPYTIHWQLTSENPECVTAEIVEGTPFFSVNAAPLPTYSVPGTYTVQPNGFESNVAETGFDSVLLRMGPNDFGFSVANQYGNDECARQSHVVTLLAPTLGIEKLLFDVRRDGTAFSGTTDLDMKLEEINPQLAKDIAILEAEIADERKWLVANATQIQDLDAKLDALQALETELGDLLTRSLDEITVEDLDEILNRYSSVVDEATREALKQVLAGLKKSVDDLQAELASLMANFGGQADAVADLLTGEARQNGFGPDDPSNYGLGPNDVPWVEVPDISNVPGAFDPANDPYAAYADDVIATLDTNVSGNQVIGRATFIATVRAWRANQAALQKAILARMSVSQAETNAFLNAQNKVTSYLQKFVDGSGWFLDAPIPMDVRANVDGTLKLLYGGLAEDLKDRLNAWDAKWNPPEANLLFDTVRAFAAGMEVAGEFTQNYVHVMQSIVHGASRVAIGFVPFVGTGMDLCEAVTGKEWCMPSGRELTTGERVFSGIGFGVGKLVKVWTGVGKAAISGEGKLAAAAIVNLGEDLSNLLKNKSVKSWRTLNWNAHGDLSTLVDFKNVFERKAAIYVLQEQGHKMLAPGDNIVRKLVGIVENSPVPGVSVACDFLTVSKDGLLVLSEVKEITGALGKVNTPHALDQLNNVMNALAKKNLAKDVARVQIITTRPAKLKGGFIPMPDGRIVDANGNFVTAFGRPDLFIHLVEL